MNSSSVSPIQNVFYFFAGLLFLFLAKVKHTVYGYTTPKPFDDTETLRCVKYDMDTVSEWLNWLKAYVRTDDYLRDKRVLELGPGSDLGIGLTLLGHGAKKYTAVDVNNLVESATPKLYEQLFVELKHAHPEVDTGRLEQALTAQREGRQGCLNYVCRPDYDLVAAMNGDTVDIFFSQAAFEHFDNVERTIAQLTEIASVGSIAILSVDLRTHSRWIRDKDPNNIYRYPLWLYRLFRFRGVPNRVRPYQYRKLFEQFGWRDVLIEPLTSLDESRVATIRPFLNRPFRDLTAEMQTLTVLICARR